MSDLSDMQALLDAIAITESRNNPNAMGDLGLKNPAYGAYQMREPAFQDVRRLRPNVAPNVKYLKDIMGQPGVQRELAAAYLDVLLRDYGLGTMDRAVGAYNAGVGTVKKKGLTGNAQKYLDTVRRNYKPRRK